MKKKIGLLGGTFNPPHYGHLLIANEVKLALGLDEIHFMPNALSPFKQKDSRVTDADRVKMVALALEEFPGGQIETVELEKGGVSYTFDTIQLLLKQQPDQDYFFIVGADQIEKLSDWYRIDELLEQIHLVGVPRPGYQLQTNYPVTLVDIPQLEVSSTLLRKRLAHHQSTQFLMPKTVAEYCEVNKLYVD